MSIVALALVMTSFFFFSFPYNQAQLALADLKTFLKLVFVNPLRTYYYSNSLVTRLSWLIDLQNVNATVRVLY